ncbi:alpha/beta hydrolase [Aestuariivirga litoralis]|uniref:alpha/beta hydrolase n=1 Tax=Aestuariivirga litoralis TaxID=2650924 RepID=UPI0018C7F731|nr:alpha/beta hydrolase [Aestuariivirga litoralis]MBG1233069.1 alpha/beta hydrolase [Aestuariivirga litoralis]
MTYTFNETPGSPGAPLIFTFHGTGGNENQFHGLAQELMPQAHVISPRGDVSEQGMLRYFRRKAEGVYDMEDLAQRTSAMADFVAAHKGDAPRVIGLGYSNGANILASVVMARPQLFSDVILMHPLIPWQPAPVDLKGTRVLITAGKHDPICPAPMTQTLADWFKAQGVEAELHWHQGGHELRNEELAAVQDFLR